MLTINDVSQALPSQLKANVSQDMVDELNALSTDPLVAEQMRNNFISYTSVMKEGRFKLEDYVAAVVYVSYRLMGYSNRESYARTFPARYQRLVSQNTSDKDISSHVSAYNKGKLPNLIMEQTLVPMWVLNQDIYQKAINTQADLMVNSLSDKVRVEAANSLLTHLKRPETKKVELDMNFKDTSGMAELKDQLAELAGMQQEAIRNGMTTKSVAHQPLHKRKEGEADRTLDAEFIDVTPAETPEEESTDAAYFA
jgi:hypothetical protein